MPRIMSGTDDRDLLAGEFALGVLEGGDLEEAERLMATDPDFARAVDRWRERLNPLARLTAPVTPPADLWRRIEASIGGNVVPLRRIRTWQAATLASLAVAASLAAFMLIRQPEPVKVAVLAPMTGGVPVLVATMERGGVLIIRPNGTISVPSGRDLELWSLAAGETRPRSLGVLPAEGRRLTAGVAPGMQLLVSLEPAGGSPTGQPTGPVLYGGTVTVVN
jgi:anti-sigma-K factor RskA